jgi:hypothetical protein
MVSLYPLLCVARTQSNAMLTPRPSALSHFFIASWNWQRIGRQSSSLTLPLAFKHVRASLGMCRSVQASKGEWELAWDNICEKGMSQVFHLKHSTNIRLLAHKFCFTLLNRVLVGQPGFCLQNGSVESLKHSSRPEFPSASFLLGPPST